MAGSKSGVGVQRRGTLPAASSDRVVARLNATHSARAPTTPWGFMSTCQLPPQPASQGGSAAAFPWLGDRRPHAQADAA